MDERLLRLSLASEDVDVAVCVKWKTQHSILWYPELADVDQKRVV